MDRLPPFTVPYEREVLAATFRVALEHIEKNGALEHVKARVPEPTARLIAKPPMRFRFISSEHIDQLYEAYKETTTRKGLFDLGVDIARGTSLSAAGPVVKMAVALFGANPASLFGNLDRFYSVATKGITFTWKQTGDREGIIDTRFQPGPPPTASATVLEGNLFYAFEVLGTETGVIEPHVALEQGHLIRVRARW